MASPKPSLSDDEKGGIAGVFRSAKKKPFKALIIFAVIVLVITAFATAIGS